MSESTPIARETAIAEPVPLARPTPLAAFLLRQTPKLAMQMHEGRITPSCFDVPQTKTGSEIGSALDSAVAVDLGWLARIAVTGDDRTRWLAGMTTNAIQTLAEGQGNYNFVLNAQGRIQGDLYAFCEKDRLVLETTMAQVDRLVQHLDRFIIMDDVELCPLTGLTALGIYGPHAKDVLGKLGFDADKLDLLTECPWTWNGIEITLVHAYSVTVPRFELWLEESHVSEVWDALLSAGCRACGVDGVETLRIVEGIRPMESILSRITWRRRHLRRAHSISAKGAIWARRLSSAYVPEPTFIRGCVSSSSKVQSRLPEWNWWWIANLRDTFPVLQPSPYLASRRRSPSE